MTQRWKLTLEYDGTDFSGWQRQDNAFSVQECLEAAIHKFCGETVTVHVAGRTDAGVHAAGQVAHIDIEKDADGKTVRDALNFHMRPHAVSILSADAVPDEFHARFKAVHRVYCYRIIMARSAVPVMEGRYAWHVWQDLDLEAMRAAAGHMLGTHDFTSFRASECQAKSPVRTMERLEFVEVPSMFAGRHIELWAEARSFLHHQIRNIAGTLKMVGEGKFVPDDIPRIIAAKDRAEAGVMAPASGLCLVRVDYP